MERSQRRHVTRKYVLKKELVPSRIELLIFALQSDAIFLLARRLNQLGQGTGLNFNGEEERVARTIG